MSQTVKMIIVVIYGVVLLGVLFFAISYDVDKRTIMQEPVPDVTRHKIGNYATEYVREFTLTDGTRCVTGYHYGMSCNWK